MRQIYYTQCPMGYGLGASNGFQIKRLTDGYPLTSDFRHFALRAFIPGTRQLAPVTLRYRLGEDGTAELARLTPRSHEYETERGPWGRPGGHFAHGLLLNGDELAAIGYWPAGLCNATFWATSDREPSREASPPQVAFPPPEAAEPSDCRSGVDEALLARLLTALATVVRDGHTLFLIAAPERLAALVALLTFAFPAPQRRALTFSTYHDRPEELPGLRLQGTTAAARPNRSVLLSQGILADVEAGHIEPAVAPARWAAQLARWLLADEPAGWAALGATHRRGRIAGARESAPCWDDDWLDNLVAFETADNAADWLSLARLASWCGRVGLGDEWARGRGPRWWVERRPEDDGRLDALVAHLSLPAAWADAADAVAWGRVVGRDLARVPSETRSAHLSTLMASAPTPQRAGFIRGLLAELPPALAARTLDELRGGAECGPEVLLPLQVRAAAGALESEGGPRALRDALAAALGVRAAAPAALDALAAAVEQRPGAAPRAGRALAEVFERLSNAGRGTVLDWTLTRDDRATWLAPLLRRAWADPLDAEPWRSLVGAVSQTQRAAFAGTALVVALDPTLPDQAFRWAVEDALLTLPPAERPDDPRWPGEFLARTGSDLDLIRWLHVKRTARPEIKAWLAEARQRGELSPAQQARLDACREYARVLRSGDARALAELRLPHVPAEERGEVLAQILTSIDLTSSDGLNRALDVVRDVWPGAFEPGSPGLAGLGAALGRALDSLQEEPAAWLDRLAGAADRLGLPPGQAYEPSGLVAQVLAATTESLGDGAPAWRLRYQILQSDAAWRCLAADVRRQLDGHPPAQVASTLERWDRALEKGVHTARFFEVWLNASDARSRFAAVVAWAPALKGLDLSWWDHARHDAARDDLRDAFARSAPMAPIPAARLVEVDQWIAAARRGAAGPDRSQVYDAAGLAPLEVLEAAAPSLARPASRLSPLGEDRWCCIKALSEFDCRGIESLGRWGRLLQPALRERVARLDEADRYRLLAWLVHLTDEFDEVPIPRLAKWLHGAGIVDTDRLARWHEALSGLVDVPEAARRMRTGLVADLRAEMLRVRNDERERRRIAGVADSP